MIPPTPEPKLKTPEYRYELPWPPSANHYWRHVGRQTLISKEGRQYCSAVQGVVWSRSGLALCLAGRLKVLVHAFPPDCRARDLDNLCKSLLDALESAGVYENDNQIDDLRIIRDRVVPGGKVIVCVQEIADATSIFRSRRNE